MTTLKTWLRRLRTLLWTALALVIIGAAVLVGVGKLLMPYSERFKPRLEAALAEQFNQPIRLDSFTGEWKAFGPRISMEGVTLLGGSGGEDALAIQQAALDVKPLNALIEGRPLYSFRIIGADLALVRFPDGRLELSGLGLSGRRVDEEGASRGLGNLARLGEVRLEDSRFSFTDQARGIEVQLVNIDGRLQMSGDRLALDVQASVSDSERPRVLGDLAATVLADLDDEERLAQLSFHLETGELMVDALAAQLPDHALKPTSGRLNAQLWGSWAPGQPQEMVGVVDIRDAGLDTGDASLLLDHLNARLNWRWRDKTQWRIDLADVRVEENGRDWTAPGIAVERNLEGNLGVWVSAEYLQAEFPLAVTQVIMEELGRRWPKAAPTGGRGPVRDFELVINGNRKLTATSGAFEDLEVLEWGRWPLAKGLSGRIDLAYGEGSLWFGGEDVDIRWPRNFRAPLVADLVDCELEILWDESDHWQVDALPCPIVSEHLEGEARLRFVRDEGKPRVDVNAHVRRADLAELHDYWPASVMSPKATDWLRRSIEAGKVDDARFVLSGDMDRFPFRGGEGVLLAEATVRDGRLAYTPGWPVAGDIDAEVRFDGPGMSVTGAIGDLAGATVQTARARVPDLRAPLLTLDYRSETDLPALQSFLEASPLLDDSELDLERFTFSGPARTEGRLDIPLGTVEGTLAVNGTLELLDAAFLEEGSSFRLESLGGVLAYDREGLRGDELQASFAGWPATLGLAAAWGTDEPFNAALEGRFPVAALTALTPLDDDPLLAMINGEANWSLGLTVRRDGPEAASDVRLLLDSDLEGVAMDLPAPLAKAPEERWPLHLEWPLNAERPQLTASLEGRLGLVAEFDSPEPEAPVQEMFAVAETPDGVEAPVATPAPDQPPGGASPAVNETSTPAAEGPVLNRGAVRFGAGIPDLPPVGELRIAGETDAMDLDGWLDAVVDYATLGSTTGGLVLRDSAVQAVNLRFLNRAFENVGLGLGWDGQALDAAFDGAAIAGDVRYSRNDDGTHTVSAQMERLVMGDPLEEGVSMDADPTTLPEMHFYVEQFGYMGLDLGRTTIEAYPIAGGLRIETVDAASPQLTFQARGDWTVVDGESRSDFDIVLTSESLGAIVEALDLSSVLEGGQTMIRYDAWWPGPPAAFGLARLNGQMTFSVIDGRILNADPGAGRVLGLMSVGALPRRLALDFDDVFESGFGFDQANGTIRLDSGTAYTDDFVLESTAAQLSISGSSDLEAQEFDYRMSVRPGVSQALPVIGAIAAGPAGAAAGLALQGLLREALGDATEARYEITGPWSDPEVVRIPDAPPAAPPEAQDPATDNFTAQAPTTEDS